MASLMRLARLEVYENRLESFEDSAIPDSFGRSSMNSALAIEFT